MRTVTWENLTLLLWELRLDCKNLSYYTGKLCIQELLIQKMLYNISWFIQNFHYQRLFRHYSFPDRTSYIVCIMVYIGTSWTDLTIWFVTSYDVVFFPPHFQCPLRDYLCHVVFIQSKKKKQEDARHRFCCCCHKFLNVQIYPTDSLSCSISIFEPSELVLGATSRWNNEM